MAHTAAGGNAHLLAIGPAEGAPAVHGTEMYALVGQQQPGRSPEQAGRDTRIRDIVLDFVTGEQTRLWARRHGPAHLGKCRQPFLRAQRPLQAVLDNEKPRRATRQLRSLRQIIESINNTLKAQLSLETMTGRAPKASPYAYCNDSSPSPPRSGTTTTATSRSCARSPPTTTDPLDFGI